MNRSRAGLTLAEVLIALAVIAIGFAALALTQVTNLRASSIARSATETKAAANRVLEDVMATVLATGVDSTTGALTFAFNDFYWSCPTAVAPPSGALPVVDGTRTCVDNRVIDNGLPSQVNVRFAIVGEPGIPGEGVLTVTVTATHAASGQALTIGDRVTCYDIYPSPTATAPEPCPPPATSGGGRP